MTNPQNPATTAAPTCETMQPALPTVSESKSGLSNPRKAYPLNLPGKRLVRHLQWKNHNHSRQPCRHRRHHTHYPPRGCRPQRPARPLQRPVRPIPRPRLSQRFPNRQGENRLPRCPQRMGPSRGHRGIPRFPRRRNRLPKHSRSLVAKDQDPILPFPACLRFRLNCPDIRQRATLHPLDLLQESPRPRCLPILPRSG